MIILLFWAFFLLVGGFSHFILSRGLPEVKTVFEGVWWSALLWVRVGMLCF